MKDEDRKLWEDRIADYRSSGLTAVQWAEDRGVAVHRLRYYIHKFNKEKKLELNQESKEVQWTSVVSKNPKTEGNFKGPLKVTIGHATIEVNSDFDEDTFESIVRILSQC